MAYMLMDIEQANDKHRALPFVYKVVIYLIFHLKSIYQALTICNLFIHKIKY